MRGTLALSSLALIWITSGCKSLDRFDTKDGEAYCGNIVSAGFVRDGKLPPNMRLEVTIDTDHMTTIPGTLTSNDGADPLDACPPIPLFSNTPMQVTDGLFHDPLSTFDFGTGRDHNFFAWAESSCRGSFLVVVSLMKSDDVEVRLMHPATDPPTEKEPFPSGWFGVFTLTRQKADCL